jgi:hypothetical protein
MTRTLPLGPASDCREASVFGCGGCPAGAHSRLALVARVAVDVVGVLGAREHEALVRSVNRVAAIQK